MLPDQFNQASKNLEESESTPSTLATQQEWIGQEMDDQENTDDLSFEALQAQWVEHWENDLATPVLKKMLDQSIEKAMIRLLQGPIALEVEKSQLSAVFSQWLKSASKEDFQTQHWVRQMCSRLGWVHKKKKEEPANSKANPQEINQKKKKPEIGQPAWERVKHIQYMLNLSKKSDGDFALLKVFITEINLLSPLDDSVLEDSGQALHGFENKDILDVVAYIPTEHMLARVKEKFSPVAIKKWEQRKYSGSIKGSLIHLWASMGAVKGLEWALEQGFDIHALEKDQHPLVFVTEEEVVKFYAQNPPIDIDWGRVEQEWLKRAASKPKEFGCWNSRHACQKVSQWLEQLRDIPTEDPLAVLSTSFQIRKGNMDDPWASRAGALIKKMGQEAFEKCLTEEGEDGGFRYNGAVLVWKHLFWLPFKASDSFSWSLCAHARQAMEGKNEKEIEAWWKNDLGGYTPAHVFQWLEWRIKGDDGHYSKQRQAEFQKIKAGWPGQEWVSKICVSDPKGLVPALNLLLHHLPKNNARSFEGFEQVIKGLSGDVRFNWPEVKTWANSLDSQGQDKVGAIKIMKTMKYGQSILSALGKIKDAVPGPSATPLTPAEITWALKKEVIYGLVHWANHVNNTLSGEVNKGQSWVLKQCLSHLPYFSKEDTNQKKNMLRVLHRWYKQSQPIQGSYVRGVEEDPSPMVCRWMAMRLFEALIEQDEHLVPFIPKNIDNPFLKKMFRFGEETKKEALAEYGGVGADWVARLQQKVLEMTLKNPHWEAQDLEAEDAVSAPAPRRRL